MRRRKFDHPNHTKKNRMNKKKSPLISFTRSLQFLSLLSDPVAIRNRSAGSFSKERKINAVSGEVDTNSQLAVQRAALSTAPEGKPASWTLPPSLSHFSLLFISSFLLSALFCFWNPWSRIYNGFLDASHTVVVFSTKTSVISATCYKRSAPPRRVREAPWIFLYERLAILQFS